MTILLVIAVSAVSSAWFTRECLRSRVYHVPRALKLVRRLESGGMDRWCSCGEYDCAACQTRRAIHRLHLCDPDWPIAMPVPGDGVRTMR